MMLKRLFAVAALLVVPSVSSAQGVGELLEGALMPQLGVGFTFDNNATDQKFQAVLGASILGPKIGTAPCYVLGAGISLSTVAPGLEDTSIAAAVVPVITCLPFGEAVGIQAGMAKRFSSPEKTPYVMVTVSVAQTPNQAKAKRLARIAAKKAKKASLDAGPPAPAS